jgi:hypothetical protein
VNRLDRVIRYHGRFSPRRLSDRLASDGITCRIRLLYCRNMSSGSVWRDRSRIISTTNASRWPTAGDAARPAGPRATARLRRVGWRRCGGRRGRGGQRQRGVRHRRRLGGREGHRAGS